jgi:hypothetical protein
MLGEVDDQALTHDEYHDAAHAAFDSARAMDENRAVVWTSFRGAFTHQVHVMVMQMPLTEEDIVH